MIRYALVALLLFAGQIAQAATINANLQFYFFGTLALKPSGLGTTITCNVELTGIATPSVATILNAKFTGLGLCPALSAAGLPWSWTPTSVTSAYLAGVKLSLAGTACNTSPVTLNGAWSNSSTAFTASPYQPLGGCIVQSLFLSPTPSFTISP
ncbi:hypothetical protein [Pseudomonas tohonis]|uniref:hypothetical protein n=1 Tax=Pseudomonas tohonis TaxID=2725477 RepID=UPI001F263A99|nr:hypothetical protein [Pseudomonas tohonis]